MNFFDIEPKPVFKKKYPTLYARDTHNKIRVWWIEQEGGKYRSASGIDGGQIVIAEWTVATGKNKGKRNATSDIQQAALEIEARYEKQLELNGYWEDIKDIDNEKFFHPMLAKEYVNYKEKLDWSKGVGVQIKYNGGRIIATKDGIFTRKGKRYVSIPHIEEALKPFFQKFPDAVLDGEGFNYELREKLNEIMKLLRKTVHITEDDLRKSKELIKFYVYDGFGFPSEKDGPIVPMTAGYLERKAAVDNAFFAPCFADRYKKVIGYVKTWVVYSEKELEALYQEFLKDRQEGAILRILGMGYENKRTSLLLKYKPEDDAEFRAISIQDGDGKNSGRVSTITFQRIDGGYFDDGTDTFNATFKNLDEDEAIRLWVTGEYKQLLNEVVTVTFNGYTGKGKPNYARLDWNNYLHDK